MIILVVAVFILQSWAIVLNGRLNWTWNLESNSETGYDHLLCSSELLIDMSCFSRTAQFGLSACHWLECQCANLRETLRQINASLAPDLRVLDS